MVDLEHHGIAVRRRPDPDDRLRYGDHRILDGEPIRAELVMTPTIGSSR